MSLAQAAVAEVLGAGDTALDATLGRGGDCLFLADGVGASGRVYGFDIQAEAVEHCRQRLREAHLESRVRLVQADHALIVRHLPDSLRGGLRAAMFNLGYLPAGDKTCITRSASTLAALQTCADWLAVGGVISVVTYLGHAGGPEEAAAVSDWAEGLEPRAWERRWTVPQAPTAPRWLLLRRIAVAG